MAQEFVIKSQDIENKVNQLLPSQGGFQAGVDFSASTMIVPIVDLTETAEGGTTRQDLQSALSLTSCTAFSVENTTSTLINTTGYFRVFGAFSGASGTGARLGTFNLTDGTTTKALTSFRLDPTGSNVNFVTQYDFIVFLAAGDSLTATSSGSNIFLIGNTRQLADISGNLVNPL